MLNNIHLNPFAISGLLITITCLGLIIILVRYGTTKVHKLWILFNLAVCIWGVGAFLVGISNTERQAIISWKIANLGAIFISVFFYHTVCIFCNLFRRKAIIFAYLQGIIIYLIILFFLGKKFLVFNSSTIPALDFFYATPAFDDIVRSIIFVVTYVLIWFSLVAVGNYELFKLYQKSNRKKRNQILFFFLGLVTGFSGGAMNFFPLFYINVYPYGNFLIPIYCVIITYAILKHQLLDIRIVVQKGFIYSMLISLITAVYFIFVFLAEKIFQGMVGYSSLFVSILYAFVIALFFIPVKNRIQHLADKIFLGKDPIQIARENELMKQELERAERLKAVAHFASGMAHEIKNPLTAIKTFAEYLPEKKNDPEFLNKFSKIVSGEVGRIDSLVHQLLDFAKPSPLNLQEIDIHNLLDDTLSLLNSEFIKHNIKLIKNYNANCRESKDANGRESLSADRQDISGNSLEISGYSRLKGDPNKLKQAFLNLFLNSIDAMPNGGTLTVETTVHGPQTTEKSMDHGPSTVDSITITITDTGSGIPDKDFPHIFEPFYSTKENGTGLGLSIVYNIIREHRGDIRAESKDGRGTLFMIKLPINDCK